MNEMKHEDLARELGKHLIGGKIVGLGVRTGGLFLDIEKDGKVYHLFAGDVFTEVFGISLKEGDKVILQHEEPSYRNLYHFLYEWYNVSTS